MIKHTENPLIEVCAGIPEIPLPSRSEDEIERLLRQYIDNISDDNDGSDNELVDEEFDRLLQEFVNAQ
jgi:hypothetical protein